MTHGQLAVHNGRAPVDAPNLALEAPPKPMEPDDPSAFRRLMADMVHELGSPLTAILAHSQILARKVPDPAVQAHARAIEEAALRCGKVVKNLRPFSRCPEDHAPLDLVGVLEKVLLVGGPELEAAGVEVRAAAGTRSRVRGDSFALQQVFTNLLLNARDAMPGGGLLVLRCRQRDGFAEVEVSDTGTGIPEEVLPRIFEPFFTTKPPGKGTGLGLAIVREIVRDHGGAIEVESRTGHGTTFRVRLSLADGNGQRSTPPEPEWNGPRGVPGQQATALSAR